MLRVSGGPVQSVDAQCFLKVGVVDVYGVVEHAGDAGGGGAVAGAFEHCAEVQAVAVSGVEVDAANRGPGGAGLLVDPAGDGLGEGAGFGEPDGGGVDVGSRWCTARARNRPRRVGRDCLSAGRTYQPVRLALPISRGSRHRVGSAPMAVVG